MDSTSLFFNIFISAIGFAYFTYGKKAVSLSFLICGLIIMIYPYFVSGLALSVIIGVILSVAPFIINRFY